MTSRVELGEARPEGQAEIFQDLGLGNFVESCDEIFRYFHDFVASMALRSVVELGIADALNSNPNGHNHPMTLSKIAARIALPSLDIARLSRLMRFLSCKKVFSATIDNDDGDILYGLTSCSKWLLTKSESTELTLAPFLLCITHPYVLASWGRLGACIGEGGPCGFSRAHGSTVYDVQSKDSEYKKVFGDGMACFSKVVLKLVLNYYKDGFKDIGSIVDVGGGSGAAMAEIVKAHPQIKGINFDLPFVVSSAPEHPNVIHIGGDMFASIPHADAIFLKGVLHNWNDEECLQILKNCKNALPERNGKVIILETVVHSQSDSFYNVEAMKLDLRMLVMTQGGKERTEDEWKKLLKGGGFPRYKIIKIPSALSIIEAY